MPRYLVTTRRALRGRVATALDALSGEPDVAIVDARDPEMVTIEASEEAAARLGEKIAATHFVDRETRHRLHSDE